MQVFFLDKPIVFVSDWINRQLPYGFAEVCMIISCYYNEIFIAKFTG
jgi:hypothetical protein